MKKTFLDARDNKDSDTLEGVRLLELQTPDDGHGPVSDPATAAHEGAEAAGKERERIAENNRQLSRKIEEDEEEAARKKKPAAFEDFNSEAGAAGMMAASAADKGGRNGYESSGENGASGLSPASDVNAGGLGAAAPATSSSSGTGTNGDFRNEWLSPRVNMNNNPGLRWWVEDMLIGTLRQQADSNIIYIKHGVSHRATMASGKTSQLLQARAQQIAAEMEADPGKHRRFRKYKDVLGRLRITDNHLMAKGWRMQEQKMQAAQASAKAPVGP